MAAILDSRVLEQTPRSDKYNFLSWFNSTLMSDDNILSDRRSHESWGFLWPRQTVTTWLCSRKDSRSSRSLSTAANQKEKKQKLLAGAKKRISRCVDDTQLVNVYISFYSYGNPKILTAWKK